MIFEDDLLNVFFIEDMLKLVGYEIVGLVKIVLQVLGLLEKGGIDVVIFDLQINDELFYEVGCKFDEMKILWVIMIVYLFSFVGLQFFYVVFLSKLFGVVVLFGFIEKLFDFLVEFKYQVCLIVYYVGWVDLECVWFVVFEQLGVIDFVQLVVVVVVVIDFGIVGDQLVGVYFCCIVGEFDFVGCQVVVDEVWCVVVWLGDD